MTNVGSTQPGPNSAGSAAAATAAALLDGARRAGVRHLNAVEGTDPEQVRVYGTATDELFAVLAHRLGNSLSQNGRHRIWHVAPFPVRRGAPHPFIQRVSRSLASQGCEVDRLYLVPPDADTDGRLQQEISRDRESSVRVAQLPISSSLTQSRIPLTDMWLIDDHLVMTEEVASDGTATWLVSAQAHEVAQGLNRRDVLLGLLSAIQVRDAIVGQGPPDLTGPLLESAHLMRAVAAVECADDAPARGRCDWYHGVWQYLRLFDMVSSPSWHAAFYDRHLRQALRAPNTDRVLVSGGADYSMLAFVLAASGAVVGHRANLAPHRRLKYHMIDRCRTPLASAKWYARKAGVEIARHALDIAETDPKVLEEKLGGKVDVIVTDAFLTRFSPEISERVLDRWHELLSPEGRIVTTVRLHPRNVARADEHAGSRAGTTDGITDFHMRLRERAEGWRPALLIDIDQLCREAREYALRIKSNNLGGEQDVRTAFKNHGFEFEHSEVAEVDGELVRTEYLRLVARKT